MQRRGAGLALALTATLLLRAGPVHAQATPREVEKVTRETQKGIQQLLRAYNDAKEPAETDPVMNEARSALAAALYQAGEALEHLDAE